MLRDTTTGTATHDPKTEQDKLLRMAQEKKQALQQALKKLDENIKVHEASPHYNKEGFHNALNSGSTPVAKLREECTQLISKIDRTHSHLQSVLEGEPPQDEELKKVIADQLQDASIQYKDHLEKKGRWTDAADGRGDNTWRKKKFNALVYYMDLGSSIGTPLDKTQGIGLDTTDVYEDEKKSSFLPPLVSIEEIREKNSLEKFTDFFNATHDACENYPRPRSVTKSMALQIIEKKRQEIIDIYGQSFELLTEGEGSTKKTRLALKSRQPTDAPPQEQKKNPHRIARAKQKTEDELLQITLEQSPLLKKMEAATLNIATVADNLKKRNRNLTGELAQTVSACKQHVKSANKAAERADTQLKAIRENYAAWVRNPQYPNETTRNEYAQSFTTMITATKKHIKKLSHELDEFTEQKSIRENAKKEKKSSAPSGLSAEEENESTIIALEERYQVSLSKLPQLSANLRKAKKLPKALEKMHALQALQASASNHWALIEKATQSIETAAKDFDALYQAFDKENVATLYSQAEQAYRTIEAARNSIPSYLKEIEHSSTLGNKHYDAVLELFKQNEEKSNHRHLPGDSPVKFYSSITSKHEEVKREIQLTHLRATNAQQEAEATHTRVEQALKKLNHTRTLLSQCNSIHGLVLETTPDQKNYETQKATIDRETTALKKQALLGDIKGVQQRKENIDHAIHHAQESVVHLQSKIEEIGKIKKELLPYLQPKAPRNEKDEKDENVDRPSPTAQLFDATLHKKFTEQYDVVNKEYETLESFYATAEEETKGFFAQKKQETEEALTDAKAIRLQKNNTHLANKIFFDFLKRNLPNFEEDVSYKPVWGGVPLTVVENKVERTYRVPAGFKEIYLKFEAYDKNPENPEKPFEQSKITAKNRKLMASDCRYRLFKLRGASTTKVYDILDKIQVANIDPEELIKQLKTIETNNKTTLIWDEKAVAAIRSAAPS